MVLLAHPVNPAVMEVKVLMVNLANLVNVVIQRHPINLSWTSSLNNAHAKHHQAIKDHLVPKDPTDQLVMLAPQVEMENLVNKDQKVHQAKVANLVKMAQKVQTVTMAKLPRKQVGQVPQEVQASQEPLALQANQEEQERTVVQVARAVLAKLVPLAPMENQVLLAQMVMQENQVTQ